MRGRPSNVVDRSEAGRDARREPPRGTADGAARATRRSSPRTPRSHSVRLHRIGGPDLSRARQVDAMPRGASSCERYAEYAIAPWSRVGRAAGEADRGPVDSRPQRPVRPPALLASRLTDMTAPRRSCATVARALTSCPRRPRIETCLAHHPFRKPKRSTRETPSVAAASASSSSAYSSGAPSPGRLYVRAPPA